MNIEIKDKLDMLIVFSARDCGKDDVEMFRNLDVSEVNLNKKFYARNRRTINRYNHKPTVMVLKKCLFRTAVALMALMSIGFLTVMAVSDLREAVLEAAVEWYDNYLSIRFIPKDGGSNADAETSSISEQTVESGKLQVDAAPPDYIEKTMKPTVIPEGAEEDIVLNDMTGVIIDYYLGDEEVLSYIQTPYNDRDKLFDNKAKVSYEIEINGYKAVMLEFESDGNAIIWADGIYYYYLHSTMLEESELIKAASSIR